MYLFIWGRIISVGISCVYKVILLHNLQTQVIHGVTSLSLVNFSTVCSQTHLLWNNAGSPQPLLPELLYLNQGTLWSFLWSRCQCETVGGISLTRGVRSIASGFTLGFIGGLRCSLQWSCWSSRWEQRSLHQASEGYITHPKINHRCMESLVQNNTLKSFRRMWMYAWH